MVQVDIQGVPLNDDLDIRGGFDFEKKQILHKGGQTISGKPQ